MRVQQGPGGRLRGASGFALIEILVVVIIIGILMAIMLPSLLGNGKKDASGHRTLSPKQRAHAVGTAEYVSQINMAIQMYKQDNDNQNPPSLVALKKYGLTDEMIYDQVTHQPIPYDPRTGQIVGTNGVDGLGGMGHGRLPVFEGTGGAPTATAPGAGQPQAPANGDDTN